jgi:hypothetical protein
LLHAGWAIDSRSFTAFAHAYWTDWAATHSLVPTVAIVARIIGVVWLYEELVGLRWRGK